jgi:hypothetical protein
MTLAEKLAERSIPEPNTGCHIWLGALSKAGYPQIWYEGRVQYAHRLSLEQKIGPLGDLEACHSCDFPPCINEDHLFPGTHKQNFEDAARKDRMAHQRGMLSGAAKLTDDQVLAIRKDMRTHRVIGREYGISNRNVSAIKRREIWRHL